MLERGRRLRLGPYPTRIERADLSLDGRFSIAISDDDQVLVWDLERVRPRSVLVETRETPKSCWLRLRCGRSTSPAGSCGASWAAIRPASRSRRSSCRAAALGVAEDARWIGVRQPESTRNPGLRRDGQAGRPDLQRRGAGSRHRRDRVRDRKRYAPQVATRNRPLGRDRPAAGGAARARRRRHVRRRDVRSPQDVASRRGERCARRCRARRRRTGHRRRESRRHLDRDGERRAVALGRRRVTRARRARPSRWMRSSERAGTSLRGPRDP